MRSWIFSMKNQRSTKLQMPVRNPPVKFQPGALCNNRSALSADQRRAPKEAPAKERSADRVANSPFQSKRILAKRTQPNFLGMLHADPDQRQWRRPKWATQEHEAPPDAAHRAAVGARRKSVRCNAAGVEFITRTAADRACD
jgi:hypothetical protein